MWPLPEPSQTCSLSNTSLYPGPRSQPPLLTIQGPPAPPPWHFEICSLAPYHTGTLSSPPGLAEKQAIGLKLKGLLIASWNEFFHWAQFLPFLMSGDCKFTAMWFTLRNFLPEHEWVFLGWAVLCESDRAHRYDMSFSVGGEVKNKESEMTNVINYGEGNTETTLLAITDKYGLPIRQWIWLYQALPQVSRNKNTSWINVCVDDWAAKRLIIASNVNSVRVDDWAAKRAIIASNTPDNCSRPKTCTYEEFMLWRAWLEIFNMACS